MSVVCGVSAAFRERNNQITHNRKPITNAQGPLRNIWPLSRSVAVFLSSVVGPSCGMAHVRKRTDPWCCAAARLRGAGGPGPVPAFHKRIRPGGACRVPCLAAHPNAPVFCSSVQISLRRSPVARGTTGQGQICDRAACDCCGERGAGGPVVHGGGAVHHALRLSPLLRRLHRRPLQAGAPPPAVHFVPLGLVGPRRRR